MSKKSVIITAGGMGKRMKSNVPKQFLLIGGIPILMKTISMFYEYNPKIEIIVALPEDQIENWSKLITKYNFTIAHKVVKGGKERFHSVKNSLSICTGDLIAVHDAVRPLITVELIDRCFEALKVNNVVVPVVEPKDSIRMKQGVKNKSVRRNNFYLVQTPQCFKKSTLEKAYHQEYKKHYTDDASVVENNGTEVFLIEGIYQNIKITNPLDLQFANFLILENNK
jgi:2-C-methyl-D-erythritol 4-phosphate cytidylyltransferase